MKIWDDKIKRFVRFTPSPLGTLTIGDNTIRANRAERRAILFPGKAERKLKIKEAREKRENEQRQTA